MFFLPLEAAIVGLLSLLLLSLLWEKPKKLHGETQAPEVAGAWPLIGHIHLLRGSNQLYLLLASMSDKYGPAFTFRIGTRCTIFVVSSWEVAKDCFTTNDKILATRPHSVGSKYMGYNHALITFAPYGKYWREMRKISTLHFLSNHHIDKQGRHVRKKEIDTCIKVLYQTSPIKVEMMQWLKDLTFNVVLTQVTGKRYFGSADVGDDNLEMKKFQKAVIYSMHLARAALLIDVFPVLEWINFKGYRESMKSTAVQLDSVLSTWLEQHKHKSKSDSSDQQDFMDVMISTLQGLTMEGFDNDTVVKATSLAMILGGTDTTTTTITWAISLLLKNPHALEKVQFELDEHVGKERHVDESDLCNLIYLQAIVKETLRLYPALPVAVPHQATQDCTIAGYHVPAGTRVMVNLWKMHRDPRVWSQPLDFQPERFLGDHAHVDVRGMQYEYLPFGSGRRACPGISFGLQAVYIILARILHAFTVETPLGEPVDMSESRSFGLVLTRATPLRVILTPRLSPTLISVAQGDKN